MRDIGRWSNNRRFQPDQYVFWFVFAANITSISQTVKGSRNIGIAQFTPIKFVQFYNDYPTAFSFFNGIEVNTLGVFNQGKFGKIASAYDTSD